MPNAHAFVVGGAPKRLAEFMRSGRSKHVKLAKNAWVRVDS
jgi:hypothetical protein